MRSLLLIFFALTTNLASFGSHARDHNGRFAVLGVGADACRHYLAAREAGGAAWERYNQWLLGYLSAFNVIVADTYDILGETDGRRLVDRLDGHCRRNPAGTLINASAALTLDLYPRRHISAPAPGGGFDQWTHVRDAPPPD